MITNRPQSVEALFTRAFGEHKEHPRAWLKQIRSVVTGNQFIGIPYTDCQNLLTVYTLLRDERLRPAHSFLRACADFLCLDLGVMIHARDNCQLIGQTSTWFEEDHTLGFVVVDVAENDPQRVPFEDAIQEEAALLREIVAVVGGNQLTEAVLSRVTQSVEEEAPAELEESITV